MKNNYHTSEPRLLHTVRSVGFAIADVNISIMYKLIKWFKDWVRIEISPEQEKRTQYFEDITRITLQIFCATSFDNWLSVRKQIQFFTMTFSDYKETKDILDRWEINIKDRKTAVRLHELDRIRIN